MKRLIFITFYLITVFSNAQELNLGFEIGTASEFNNTNSLVLGTSIEFRPNKLST